MTSPMIASLGVPWQEPTASSVPQRVDFGGGTEQPAERGSGRQTREGPAERGSGRQTREGPAERGSGRQRGSGPG